MADGSHKMSRGEFEVALGALGDATRKVRAVSRDIQGDLGQIRGQFARLPGVWRSPSESSSEPVMKWFDRASADLHALLEEMTRRMQVSYDTYVDAEKANFHNSGGGSGSSHGAHPPQQHAQGSHPAPHEGTLRNGETDPRPEAAPQPEAALRDRLTGQGASDA
ncbi:WXG100 family type VII secretion target [Streptomyces sp. NPDC050400]|uniref:WXG100 family type VII secretion target n=1 Tax=Streptomyces sp. NPDC050400 TaxID=3365610 RepID=UPI00379F5A92